LIFDMNMWWRVIIVPHAHNDPKKYGQDRHDFRYINNSSARIATMRSAALPSHK
jgi:hypothetical protein